MEKELDRFRESSDAQGREHRFLSRHRRHSLKVIPVPPLPLLVFDSCPEVPCP